MMRRAGLIVLSIGATLGAQEPAARVSATARPDSIALCAAAPDAESIGTLMFGPRASASPHAHIAHVESRRCASRKLRIASGWSNA